MNFRPLLFYLTQSLFFSSFESDCHGLRLYPDISLSFWFIYVPIHFKRYFQKDTISPLIIIIIYFELVKKSIFYNNSLVIYRYNLRLTQAWKTKMNIVHARELWSRYNINKGTICAYPQRRRQRHGYDTLCNQFRSWLYSKRYGLIDIFKLGKARLGPRPRSPMNIYGSYSLR